MKNYKIYKALSKTTNKSYIGITGRSIKHRMLCHYWDADNGSEYHFHRAIRKYGREDFEWTLLEENLTLEKLKEKEIFYINQLDTVKNGYNMSLGGEGAFGAVRSQEYKDRLAARNYNFFSDEANVKSHSEKIKLHFKNHPEARKNMSEKTRKRNLDPEYQKKWKKNVNKIFGTYEYRLKNSKKKGGKPFNVYNYKTNKFVGKWEIINECARNLKINHSKIILCLKGKRNHTGGYSFKYVD